MANRKQRQEIAKETLLIQNKGCYETIDKKTVQIKDGIKYCNENSRVYDEEDFSMLCKKESKKTVRTTKFEVTNEHAITSCLRLSTEISDDDKVICLNFASAKNVCGGMVGGSLAQEENLGLCSSLHSSLSQFQKEYYDMNRRNPKDGLYHNILMYSPDCVVFRNDKTFELLESPVKVSFVSSPAVNKGVASKRGIKPEVITDTMRNRIHHVLAVAAETGHNVVILGAWGCGVFRNDPRDIAMEFAYFLREPNGIFSNVFRRVIFAVGTERNKVEPFREVFA